MNCKKCGYPLFSNDKVCKRCGEEVVRESDIPEVTEEKANTETPIAPVIGDGGKLDSSTPIVDPTKPAAPTNSAPIPELATLDAPPKVFEEPKEEERDVIPTVEEPVDPKEAPIPDLNNIPDPTKEEEKVEEKVEEEVPAEVEAPEEPKQEINTGAIPDPTKPQEEVKEVELPNINNGPIEPVVGKETEEKKTSFDTSYDKIEGPKSLSSFMSLMGVGHKEEEVKEETSVKPEPQEEEEYKIDVTKPIGEISYDTKEENKVANINQTLPSLPNDKKSSSSVVIPKKPEPINNGNSGNTNIPKQNNPEMDDYQRQMENYDETKANEPVQNNQNFNQQQVLVEQKKKKKNPIGIILLLIILGVGGYFGYKYLKDSGILSGEGKTNTVEFASYKFQVPDKYKTQINTNNLVVYDDTNILAFAFINGSYNEFSSALTLENFNSLGNKATYLGEKEQDGNKYHLYQVVVGEKNAYVGYIAKGDIKIICFSVEPKTGSTLPSEDYLKSAIKIAISAEFSGNSEVVESSGTNENAETSETVEAGSQALTGEAASAGDIDDEPVYEETYVNITLNEINE